MVNSAAADLKGAATGAEVLHGDQQRGKRGRYMTRFAGSLHLMRCPLVQSK